MYTRDSKYANRGKKKKAVIKSTFYRNCEIHIQA